MVVSATTVLDFGVVSVVAFVLLVAHFGAKNRLMLPAPPHPPEDDAMVAA